ncbi:hypothetical protein Agabi119p4_3307 [Agaricus bisporus var. burnettii]|uniref:Uncharacterized protein n=1 Tax=Agaricus bisporus var. burnettii TaxID=192524 RepID=A0A8H7F6U4_AGABI|nr:hypothetical protein Agabi119p4_3307 [Agaricus bisporus var. burnettii]
MPPSGTGLRTLGLLRDVLQLCPLLETLDINDIDYIDAEDVQYPLPSSHSCVPRIVNYHGPANLASKVLAACPFKNLSLHTGKSKENTYGQCEIQRLLRPLAHHSPAHIGLSVVYPDTKLCDTLSMIFSDITSLHICYNDPEPLTAMNDGSQYRQIVVIDDRHSFMWQIRPRTTMMGILDRLVTRESSLPQGLIKLRFTQADPYSSRQITRKEQHEYLDRLLYSYKDLMFFQLGDNPPLIRSGGDRPWYEAGQQ